MATIVTRAGKGSKLTHAEMDANFTNLNTDKIETSRFPNVDANVTSSDEELNGLDGLTASGVVETDVSGILTAKTLTASSNVRTDGSGALEAGSYLDFRGCLVNMTSTLSIGTGSFVKVDWDEQQYDTDDIWEGVTNPERFTIPTGVTKIRITARIEWASSATADDRLCYIYKNGALFTGPGSFLDRSQDANNYNSGIVHNVTTGIISVAGGTDYFELRMFNNASTSQNIGAGNANQTWAQVELLDE